MIFHTKALMSPRAGLTLFHLLHVKHQQVGDSFIFRKWHSQCWLGCGRFLRLSCCIICVHGFLCMTFLMNSILHLCLICERRLDLISWPLTPLVPIWQFLRNVTYAMTSEESDSPFTSSSCSWSKLMSGESTRMMDLFRSRKASFTCLGWTFVMKTTLLKPLNSVHTGHCLLWSCIRHKTSSEQ